MTASQSGVFSLQEFADTGILLAGGRIYTYTAGTTTQKTAYTDAAGTIPQTYTSDGQGGSYIALNARGELPAPLYLTTGSYDITLKRADGTTVWTRQADPVADASTVAVAALSATLTPYLNAFTYIFGDGATDRSAAISAANTLGKPVVFVGIAVVGTPTTITVPIVDTTAQIFSAASQITVANGLPVRPEWFGSASGNVYKAAKVLAQPKGGVVLLSEATYPDQGFAYNGAYMDVPNVTFRGAKMPLLSGDCKSLTGGSIINGTFLVFADNVAIENVGIDCGNGFTNGGAAKDALFCTFNSDAAKAANAQHKGLRLHNVIGLCNGPNDTVHSALAGEGYTDVHCTGEIVGVYGVHGVVVKCTQVTAESFSAYLNGTDGVVIKSDTQTTARATDIQIGNIRSLAGGPSGWTPYVFPTTTTGSANYGVYVHAFGGNVGKIQIGRIIESGHANGFTTRFDGAYVLDTMQIESIVTDNNADTGIWLTASTAAGASMARVHIGVAEPRNATTGVIFDWQNASTVKVGTLHAVNCSVAAVAATSIANPTIDTLIAENCAAAYQITSTSKPCVGKTLLAGTTTVYYSAAGSGQVPSLSNSWVQAVGGDSVNYLLTGYGVEINGLVSGGTTNVICTLPQFLRPATEKRFLLQGRSGSTQAAIPVWVTSAGVVTINDAAGGIANVSNYLSLAGLRFSANI